MYKFFRETDEWFAYQNLEYIFTNIYKQSSSIAKRSSNNAPDSALLLDVLKTTSPLLTSSSIKGFPILLLLPTTKILGAITWFYGCLISMRHLKLFIQKDWKYIHAHFPLLFKENKPIITSVTSYFKEPNPLLGTIEWVLS